MVKLGRPHNFLEQVPFIPFAHRGGTSDAPENSLRSFLVAYETGFRFMETDVHASSDGVLFAFHDNDLNRTCGADVLIENLTSYEIEKYRVDGTDPIPKLTDLLEAMPDAFFNIDCKADTALQPLIRDLAAHNLLDRACIGSFSDRRLRAIREEFGHRVCTSAGPREVTAITVGAGVKPDGPNCLQIPMRQGPINLASQRFIKRAHRLGLPVHYWTIDDPEHMHRLIKNGADGIMTDHPKRLRSTLSEISKWPH